MHHGPSPIEIPPPKRCDLKICHIDSDKGRNLIFHGLICEDFYSRLEMADDAHVFYHLPLATAGQIRLLRLLPNLDARQRIQGQIYVVEIGQAVEYRAISYEWGPAPASRPIAIDGKELEIRINLWNFLDTFRQYADNDVLLWIDQISIDQASIQERNYHVHLMSRIFADARNVVAWVGPSTLQVSQIDKVIQRHMDCPLDCNHDRKRSLCERDMCALCSAIATHTTSSVDIRSGGKCFLRYAWRLNPAESMADLVSIGTATYWTRLWVAQEILLARKLFFLLGGELVSEARLYAYLNCLGKLWTSSGHDIPATHRHAVDLFTQRDGNINFTPFPYKRYTLEDVIKLVQPHRLLCAEPRDNIYGLLGLVEESDVIPVDYNLAGEDLFILVLERLVRSTSDFDQMLGITMGLSDKTKLSTELAYVSHQLGLPQQWRSGLDFFAKDDLFQAFMLFFQTLQRLALAGFDRSRWTVNQLGYLVCAITFDQRSSAARRGRGRRGAVPYDLNILSTQLNRANDDRLEDLLAETLQFEPHGKPPKKRTSRLMSSDRTSKSRRGRDRRS